MKELETLHIVRVRHNDKVVVVYNCANDELVRCLIVVQYRFAKVLLCSLKIQEN